MESDERQPISRRTFTKAAGASLLFGSLGSACDTNGTFDGFFQVSEFSCNKLKAEPTETLTLQWDYELPEKLKAQRLRFLRLHLSGIAQEVVELDLDVRSFTFTFSGPITVEVQGAISSVDPERPFVPSVSAALTVNRLQDFFFTGDFRSASNTARAPYLGYPQDDQAAVIEGQTITVDFTQFVGFFDANSNGQIEPLSSFGSIGRSFRALSLNSQESLAFGFTEGPTFPAQLAARPELGSTNGIIYAGAIVMNGQDLAYKSDDGEGNARRSVSTGQGATSGPLGFDPIFVSIGLLEDGSQLNIADIQIGNLNQKLVTTVTTNPLLFSTTSIGTPTVAVDRTSGLSTGTIKEGRAGVSITPSNGADDFDALVAFSLRWQTEYLRDESLLDVITLG